MCPLLSIQDNFTAERFLVPFCRSSLSRISMKLLHTSMIMTILWFCTSSRKTTHLNRKVRLLNHPFQLTPDLCDIFSLQEYTVRRCSCQWRRSSSWQYVFFPFSVRDLCSWHIYSVEGLPFGGIGPSGSKLSSYSMLVAWFIFTTQTATTVASIPSTCSLT